MAQQNANSHTVWERLDPLSRNKELTGTLRMELADPLWMLSRQRQFGEFRGEDAGSPVNVDLKYRHDHTAKVQVGSKRMDYDAGENQPVETLVEREPVAAQAEEGPNMRIRTEAGMHFLARLRESLSGNPPVPADFDEQFWLGRPEVADDDDRRFYDILGTSTDQKGNPSTRALDGHAVYTRFTTEFGHIADPNTATDWSSADTSRLPRPKSSTEAISSGYKEAAEGFVLWYAGLYDEPGEQEDAWDPQRMEYSATVSTGSKDNETVFEAKEYPGGRMDWHSFEVSDDPARSLWADQETVTFDLDEVNDSGISGTATLASSGEQTEVTVALKAERSASLDTLRATHIRSGQCNAELGDIEFQLADMTDRAVTVVDATLGSLMDGNHAITVLKSSEESGASVACGSIPVATSDLKSHSRLPTKVSFRGMPASRLWEMEDASINLSAISAAGDDLSRLFLLEFALIAGDDWFSLPIQAPVGSLTRVTDLKVTDTFGITTNVGPTIGREDATGWSMFDFQLPAHDEPGLFLPPVLGATLNSEPIERVRFARDEMANLLFGIEELFEGPLGHPIDRSVFTLPELVIAEIHPADSVDEEYIELHNAGDDVYNLDGLELRLKKESSSPLIYEFPDISIDARDSLRVYIGGDSNLNTRTRIHTDHAVSDPQRLAADASVAVYEEWVDHDNSENRLLVIKPVQANVLDGLDRYRLVSEVPDHWFPYVLEDVNGVSHRFKLALLLDADALSGSIKSIPRPRGRIMDPDADIFEDVITRGGLEVTRRYQLTAWLDGTTHVWSGRRVKPGRGEESSGLRFDWVESSETDD